MEPNMRRRHYLVYLLMFAILVVWGISFYTFVDISEEDLRSYGHLIQPNNDDHQYLSRKKRDSSSKINNTDAASKGKQNDSIFQNQVKSSPKDKISLKLTTHLITVPMEMEENASHQKEVTSTTKVLNKDKNEQSKPTTEKSNSGTTSTFKGTANKEVTSSSLISTIRSIEKKVTELPHKNLMAATKSKNSNKLNKNDKLDHHIDSEITTLPNPKKLGSSSSLENLKENSTEKSETFSTSRTFASTITSINSQTTQSKNVIFAKSSTGLGAQSTVNLQPRLTKIDNENTATTPYTEREGLTQSIKSTTIINLKSITSGNDVTNTATVTNSKPKLTTNLENFETKTPVTAKSKTNPSKSSTEPSNFNGKQSTNIEKLHESHFTTIDQHTTTRSEKAKTHMVTMEIPASNKSMSSLVDTPKLMTTLTYIPTSGKLNTKKQTNLTTSTISPRLLAPSNSNIQSTMHTDVKTTNNAMSIQKLSLSTFVSKASQTTSSNLISLTTRKPLIGMSQVLNMSSTYSSKLVTSATTARQVSSTSTKATATSKSSKTISKNTLTRLETTPGPKNSAGSTSSILQSVTKTISSSANAIYNSIVNFKFNYPKSAQTIEKSNFTLKQTKSISNKLVSNKTEFGIMLNDKKNKTLAEVNQTITNNRHKRQVNFTNQGLEMNVSNKNTDTDSAFDPEKFTKSDFMAITAVLNNNGTDGKTINSSSNFLTPDQDVNNEISGSNANTTAFNNNKTNSVEGNNTESIKGIEINSSDIVTYNSSLPGNNKPEKHILPESNLELSTGTSNISKTDIDFIVKNENSSKLEQGLTNSVFKDFLKNETKVASSEQFEIGSTITESINETFFALATDITHSPTINTTQFHFQNDIKKPDSTELETENNDGKNRLKNSFGTESLTTGYPVATTNLNSVLAEVDNEDSKSASVRFHNNSISNDEINSTISKTSPWTSDNNYDGNHYFSGMQTDKTTIGSVTEQNPNIVTNLVSALTTKNEKKELDSMDDNKIYKNSFKRTESGVDSLGEPDRNTIETAGLSIKVSIEETTTTSNYELNTSTNNGSYLAKLNKVDSIYLNNTSFSNDEANSTISKINPTTTEISNDKNEYSKLMQMGLTTEQNFTNATRLVSLFSNNNETKEIDLKSSDSDMTKSELDGNETNFRHNEVNKIPDYALSLVEKNKTDFNSLNNMSFSDKINSTVSKKSIETSKFKNSDNEYSNRMETDKIINNSATEQNFNNDNDDIVYFRGTQADKTTHDSETEQNPVIFNEAEELDSTSSLSNSMTSEMNDKKNYFRNSIETAESNVTSNNPSEEISTITTSILSSTAKTNSEESKFTNNWLSSLEQNKVHLNMTSSSNTETISTSSKLNPVISEINNNRNEYSTKIESTQTTISLTTEHSSNITTNLILSVSTDADTKYADFKNSHSTTINISDKSNVNNLNETAESSVAPDKLSKASTSTSNFITNPNEIAENNINETYSKNLSLEQKSDINEETTSKSIVNEQFKDDKPTIPTKPNTETSKLAEVNHNISESTVLLITDRTNNFNSVTSSKIDFQAVMDNNESPILLTSILPQNSIALENASTLPTFTNDKKINSSLYVTSGLLEPLVNSNAQNDYESKSASTSNMFENVSQSAIFKSSESSSTTTAEKISFETLKIYKSTADPYHLTKADDLELITKAFINTSDSIVIHNVSKFPVSTTMSLENISPNFVSVTNFLSANVTSTVSKPNNVETFAQSTALGIKSTTTAAEMPTIVGNLGLANSTTVKEIASENAKITKSTMSERLESTATIIVDLSLLGNTIVKEISSETSTITKSTAGSNDITMSEEFESTTAAGNLGLANRTTVKEISSENSKITKSTVSEGFDATATVGDPSLLESTIVKEISSETSKITKTTAGSHDIPMSGEFELTTKFGNLDLADSTTVKEISSENSKITKSTVGSHDIPMSGEFELTTKFGNIDLAESTTVKEISSENSKITKSTISASLESTATIVNLSLQGNTTVKEISSETSTITKSTAGSNDITMREEFESTTSAGNLGVANRITAKEISSETSKITKTTTGSHEIPVSEKYKSTIKFGNLGLADSTTIQEKSSDNFKITKSTVIEGFESTATVEDLSLPGSTIVNEIASETSKITKTTPGSHDIPVSEEFESTTKFGNLDLADSTTVKKISSENSKITKSTVSDGSDSTATVADPNLLRSTTVKEISSENSKITKSTVGSHDIPMSGEFELTTKFGNIDLAESTTVKEISSENSKITKSTISASLESTATNVNLSLQGNTTVTKISSETSTITKSTAGSNDITMREEFESTTSAGNLGLANRITAKEISSETSKINKSTLSEDFKTTRTVGDLSSSDSTPVKEISSKTSKITKTTTGSHEIPVSEKYESTTKFGNLGLADSTTIQEKSSDNFKITKSTVIEGFESTATVGDLSLPGSTIVNEIASETSKITKTTPGSHDIPVSEEFESTTKFGNLDLADSTTVKKISSENSKITKSTVSDGSDSTATVADPNLLRSTIAQEISSETFTLTKSTLSEVFKSTRTIRDLSSSDNTPVKEISSGTSKIAQSTLSEGFGSTATVVDLSLPRSSIAQEISSETSKITKSTADPQNIIISERFESTTKNNLGLADSTTVKDISNENSKITKSRVSEGLESTATVGNLSLPESTTVKITSKITKSTEGLHGITLNEDFESTTKIGYLSVTDSTTVNEISSETSKIAKSIVSESPHSTTTVSDLSFLGSTIVKEISSETSKITKSTASPRNITRSEEFEPTAKVGNLSLTDSTTVNELSSDISKVTKSTVSESFESTTKVGDRSLPDSTIVKEMSSETSKISKSTTNLYDTTVNEGVGKLSSSNSSKLIVSSTLLMENFTTVSISPTILLNANATSSVTTSDNITAPTHSSTFSGFEDETSKMLKSTVEINNITVSKRFESTSAIFENLSSSSYSNVTITDLTNNKTTPREPNQIDYESTATEGKSTLLTLPTEIVNTTNMILNTNLTTITISTNNKPDFQTSSQPLLITVSNNVSSTGVVELSSTISAITTSDYSPITTGPTEQDTSSILSFSPSTIIPRHLNWIVCSPLEKFCLKTGKCVMKKSMDIDYYSKRECEMDPNCIQKKVTCKEPEIQKPKVCPQNQIYCLESGSCISCPNQNDRVAEFANPFITESPIEPQLEKISSWCPANHIVYPLPVSITCLQDGNCPFKSSCCKSFDQKATCVWLINPNNSICPEYFHYCESTKQCQLLTLPCDGECSNSWKFCPTLNRCALNDSCLNETENNEFGLPFTLPDKLTPELIIKEFSTYLEDKPIIIEAINNFAIQGLTDYTMEMKEEYLLRYFDQYIFWNLTSSEYLSWEKTFSAFLSVKLPIIEVQSIFTSSGVPSTQKPDVFNYFPCIDSDAVLSIVNQNNSKATYCNGDEHLSFKLRQTLELRSKPNFNGNITIVVQPIIVDITNTRFSGSRKHFTVHIQPVEDVPKLNWRVAELDFDIMTVTKVKESSLIEGWPVQSIVSSFFNDPDGNELGMALVTAQFSPLGNWQYQTETNEWENIEEIDPYCKLMDMLKINLNHQGLVNIDGKDEMDVSRIRRSIIFSSDITQILNTNATTTDVISDSLKNLNHGEFSSYFTNDYLLISDTNLFALHRKPLKFYNVNNISEINLDLSWRQRKPHSPILPCDGRDMFTGPNAIKWKTISYDFPDPVIGHNDLKADMHPDLSSNNQNIDSQFQNGLDDFIRSLTTTMTTTTTTSTTQVQTSTTPNLSLAGSLPTNANLGAATHSQTEKNKQSGTTNNILPSENMIKSSDVPSNTENLIPVMQTSTSKTPKSSITGIYSDSKSTINSVYTNDQKTTSGNKNNPPTRPPIKNTNDPLLESLSSSSTISPNNNANPTNQANTDANAADDPKRRPPRVVPSNDTSRTDSNSQTDGSINHSSSTINLNPQVTHTRNPANGQTLATSAGTGDISTRKNVSPDLQFNASSTGTPMTTASTTIATTTTVKPLTREEEEKFHEVITLRETVILFLPPKVHLRFIPRNVPADNQTWWSLTDAMQYSKLMFAAWDPRNSNISTAIKETIDIQLCSKQNKSCKAFNDSITPQLAVYHLRIVDSSTGASLIEPRGQDLCGVCGGNNDTCLDCNGVANGSSFMECGKCVKNSSECTNLTAKYFEYKEPTIKYCLLDVNTSFIDECGACQPNKSSKSPQICGKCYSLIDKSVPKTQFNHFYCNDTWNRDRMIEAVGFGPQPHQRWHRISGSQPVVFLDLCSFHGSSIYLHLYGPSWSYQTKSFSKGECDLINAQAIVKGHMTAIIKEDRVQVKLSGLTNVMDHRMVCRLTTVYDETYTLSPFAKLSVIDSKNIKIENITPPKISANQNITIKIQGNKFINTSELTCFYMRHPARQAFRLSAAKFVNENLVECKVESNTFNEGMTVDVGVVYTYASILQYNIRHSYLLSSAMMDVIGQGPILNHLELSNDLTSVIAKFSCNVVLTGNCDNIFQYMGGFGKNISCYAKSNEITISPIEDLYQIQNSHRILSPSSKISCANDVSVQTTAGQTILVSDNQMKPLSFDISGPSQICFGYAFFEITLLDGNWFDNYQLNWTLQSANIVLNNPENKKLLQVRELTTHSFKSNIKLKIDANQLLPEIQYNLSATISNSQITVVKTVQIVNTPLSKIVTNIYGYSTVDPQHDLYLEANVSICPAYLNEERPRLSYYWEIDGSCINLDRNRGRILKLYKDSLEGGRRYVVRCLVIANGDPKTVSTAEFVLNTLIDKPIVIIPVKNVSFTLGQTINLNGEGSYDPYRSSNNLKYNWSCMTIDGEDCICLNMTPKVDLHSKINRMRPILNVDGHLLSVGNYIFELIITTTDGRNASDIVYVSVIPGSEKTPAISVVKGSRSVQPEDAVDLRAYIIGSGGTEIVWKPSRNPGFAYFDFFVSRSTDWASTIATEKPAQIPLTTSIAANTLQVDSQYKLQIIASHSLEGQTWAEVIIKTSSKPLLNISEVGPTEGEAIFSKFTVCITDPWMKDKGISIRVGYKAYGTSRYLRQLVGPSTCLHDLRFPAVASPRGYLSVLVEACDSNSVCTVAESKSHIQVKVPSLATEEKMKDFRNTLSDYIYEGDFDAAIAHAFSCIQTLSIVGLDRKVTVQAITASLDDLIRRKILTILSKDLSSAEMSDIYSSLKDLSYILGSRKFQPSKYTLTVLEELSQMLINRYIRRKPIAESGVLPGSQVISRDKREVHHLKPGERFRSQYFKGRFVGNHRIRRSAGTDLYNRKLIKMQGRTRMTSSNNDTVYVSELLTPISASQAKTLLRANDLLVNIERSYTANVNSQILKDLPDFWMAICRGLIANGVPVVIRNDVLTLQTLKIEMDKLVIDGETNFTIEDTANSQNRRRGKSQVQFILNENAFEMRPKCDGTRDNCGTMCLGTVKFNDDPLVNSHSQSHYQMSDIFAIWPVLCDNLAEVNLLDSLIEKLVLSITIPTVSRDEIPYLKCRAWDDSRRKWKTELCNTTAIILRDHQNDIEVVCTCSPLVFFGVYLDGTQAPKRWVTQSPPAKPSPTSAIYPLSRAPPSADPSKVTPPWTKSSKPPGHPHKLHAKTFVIYFKIQGIFNRITCNNVTTFIETMRRELSYRFDVPPATFAHFLVEPGSAQITMTVAPDPETTSEQEARNLMNTMKNMIKDGTFCFTNQNNELICAEPESYQLVQSDYKTHAKGSSIIGTIIGIVIAIVIGIVALCIIRTICKKKRKKKNAVGVEPLNKNPTYKQVNQAQVQPIDDAHLLEGYIDSRPNYRMTMGKQVPGTKDSYRVNVKHGQPISSEEQLIKPSHSKDSAVPNGLEEPRLPNQMDEHESSQSEGENGPSKHVNGPGPSNELRSPNKPPPEPTQPSTNGQHSLKAKHAKSKE